MTTDDQARLHATLARFLPHTQRDRIALTGGLAIDVHAAESGCGRTRDAVADIDFVATSPDVIAPAATRDLLVSHFHLPHEGYPKFLVQLVDPQTRLRVDIFPDLAGSIALATPRVVAGHHMLVLNVRSIFDHKRQTLAKATAKHPVDYKHLRDATLLAAWCNRKVDPIPPPHLTTEIYERDFTPCRRCEVSKTPGFVPAAPEAIFEILGYN